MTIETKYNIGDEVWYCDIIGAGFAKITELVVLINKRKIDFTYCLSDGRVITHKEICNNQRHARLRETLMNKQILNRRPAGLVVDPTLGLVGEYKDNFHNPEVIAPLSMLKAIMLSKGDEVKCINAQSIHYGKICTVVSNTAKVISVTHNDEAFTLRHDEFELHKKHQDGQQGEGVNNL